jgi:hypothetical protein
LYGRVSHVYGKWGFLTVLWHVAPQNTEYLETAARPLQGDAAGAHRSEDLLL